MIKYKIKPSKVHDNIYCIEILEFFNKEIRTFYSFNDVCLITYLSGTDLIKKIKKYNGWISGNIFFSNRNNANLFIKECINPSIIIRTLSNKTIQEDIEERQAEEIW